MLIYNVQVNAERAILYCNVNVSCKEKGLIQTIARFISILYNQTILKESF